MDARRAIERIRDGTDTLLRELDLPRAEGFPEHSDLTGVYKLIPQYEPNRWRGFQYVGFLAGRLWLLASVFGEERYAEVAADLCRRIEPQLSAGPVEHENSGFDIFYAYAFGHNYTGDDWYRDAGLRALANYEQLFRPELRLFLCEADSDEVVIDTAGPLVCFFWGGQWKPHLRDLLKTHMDRILELGLVGEDGQAFQGVQFDLERNEVKRYYSRQGYAEKSHWTRAQAWAVHNYLNGFEGTGDPAHLGASLRAAAWFWDHLPESKVNFYDYDDPGAPAIPLDTCASLMAANAFLRYSRIPEVPEGKTWFQRGREIIERVCEDHMTLGGTVIHGSWGRIRERLCIGRFPQEDVMAYGNYWVVEGLYRLVSDDWTVPRIRD